MNYVQPYASSRRAGRRGNNMAEVQLFLLVYIAIMVTIE